MSGATETAWTVETIRVEAERIAEDERRRYCPDAPPETDTEPEPESQERRHAASFTIDPKRVIECLRKSQVGDAQMFTEIHRGRFLFDHAAGRWYRWTNHFWTEDKTETVTEAMQAVVEAYETELQRSSWRVNAARSRDKPDKGAEEVERALRQRITVLRTRSRIDDVLRLARGGDSGLGISGNEWDADPMLLGCKNGVIDLRTGVFRAGQPSDYTKTISPVTWQGLNAPCPVWERFLSDVFNGDQDLIGFIQRWVGYCLTGKTNEEKCLVLYGKGRNGKSKFVEVLQGILGDYFHALPMETLLQQRNDGSPGGARADLMSLRGKRLAVAAESNDGRRLNAAKLKAWTGGDPITARSPFGRHEVTFNQTAKIMLQTNFKPKIPADDYAVWQRVLLVPFIMCFVENPKAENERKRDIYLKDKLAAEYPAVLSWSVRGCLEWQRVGFNPPAAVVTATKNYQAENDTIQDFLNTCCQMTGQAQAKVLFDAFCEYCEDCNVNPLRSNEFAKQMDTRFDHYTAHRKKFYIGISLIE
jgi:putative DNA primase/helicase